MSARKRFSLVSPLMRILLTLGLLIAAGAGHAIERVTYYHNDALGSPVAATDRNGTLLWRETYAPYGERLTREASSKDTVWYTGKQEEAAFGINYFGARWYDPRIGRFMGVDPAGFSAGDIQSFNKYAYANNNPYAYVDPDGQFPLILFAPVIAEGFGAVLAGGINAAQQYYETGHVRWSGVGGVFDAAGDGALLGLGTWSAFGLATEGTATGAESGLGSVPKGTPKITEPYKRPSGATTQAQRQSVQGKPCVDCGSVTSKQVADHKDPLVKEYYRTGTIDTSRMRGIDAVQSQCPTCSARQGAELSRFSRQMKKEHGLE